MIGYAVQASALILAVAMVLAMWRLVRGPDAVDRVLALDTLYVNAVAILLVYGVHTGLDDLDETAMLIALLGFISTVSLTRALARGRLIEPGSTSAGGEAR